AFQLPWNGNRHTGGDLPDHRNSHDLPIATRAIDEFDTAGDVPVAANETAALEDFQVVVDNAGGGDIQFALNVPNRGLIVILIEEVRDEIKDRLLPAGKVFHGLLRVNRGHLVRLANNY